ncbi:MAG: hypothetical protein P8Y03_30140 [Anaerolineales bacterium]|jgi:hypothetical protein
MNRILIIFVVVILIAALAWAASAAPLSLSLKGWRINSGGGESTGGQFRLFSAIGQPEAGSMSGGSYALSGGFLGKASPPSMQIFLPILVKP